MKVVGDSDDGDMIDIMLEHILIYHCADGKLGDLMVASVLRSACHDRLGCLVPVS